MTFGRGLPMKLGRTISAALVGTALGLFATWLTIVRVARPGGVENGPWRTDVEAGNPRGNPYTRARVALHGFLALNAGETVYYTATHDGEGHRLDGRCVYEISGHDPDARWWSTTAYGRDEFLIADLANRYSVSTDTVAREPGEPFWCKWAVPMMAPIGLRWSPAGSRLACGFTILARGSPSTLPTLCCRRSGG